jgi:hypothetical protein
MWTQVHRRNAIGVFCAAMISFCVFGWLLASDIYFYLSSERFTGSVAAVSYELVPRGKGSAMAYVPIVQVSGLGRIKPDTSEDSPVYSIGSLMDLRCTRESTPSCRIDRLISLWAASLTWFLITIAFLGVGLILKGHSSLEESTSLDL